MTSSDVDARERARLLREASCLKCAHMPVCIVFRGAQQIIAEFPEDDETKGANAPFRADEVAKICAYYAPPSVMPLGP
jgi:hypothetical protein